MLDLPSFLKTQDITGSICNRKFIYIPGNEKVTKYKKDLEKLPIFHFSLHTEVTSNCIFKKLCLPTKSLHLPFLY